MIRHRHIIVSYFLLLGIASAGSPLVLHPTGSFKLPRRACGASTAYSAGCLTLREVNGQLRLLSDAGGCFYEATVPALRQTSPYTAEVVKDWGDLYQGEGVATNLRWDAEEWRLWWTGGPLYDTDNLLDLCTGSTNLKTQQFRDRTLAIPQLWQRGGTLELPLWVQKKTGQRIAYGFGGYYSIFAEGSYGPALAIDGCQLLAYPDWHRCPRPGNYWCSEDSWVALTPDLDGQWTAADEIGGENCAAGAVWISMPDIQAVLFFVSLGTGHIWYGDDGLFAGVHCEDRENWIAVYQASDLMRVWRGEAEPSDPQPQWLYLGGPGRVAGVHWTGQQLLVCHLWADPGEEESYPVVVGYRVEAP